VGRRARRVRANKDGAFDGAGHGCGKEIYGGLQPFYGDVFTVTVRAATRLLVVAYFPGALGVAANQGKSLDAKFAK